MLEGFGAFFFSLLYVAIGQTLAFGNVFALWFLLGVNAGGERRCSQHQQHYRQQCACAIHRPPAGLRTVRIISVASLPASAVNPACASAFSFSIPARAASTCFCALALASATALVRTWFAC